MDSVWFEALVFVLGVFLAIFLLLGIILTVIVIRVARLAKRITEHAEQVADRAEHVSAFFEKTATPVALMKLVANFTDILGKKGRKK